MTRKELGLAKNINKLISDIDSYINSNNDWIYYFLNPIAGGNEELFSCMEEHPEDWEDYIDFEIYNISKGLIYIKIHIDDNTDCGITFGRYITIANFSETVKRNKMLYMNKGKELKEKNIKEDIERLKKMLALKEEELKNL